MLGLVAISETPISTIRTEDEEYEYFLPTESDVLWTVELTTYQPVVEE